MKTNLQMAGLLVAALTAAQEAAEKENVALGPESQRGLDCGFAWVTIKPARGAFINECKARNIGETKDWGGGGYYIPDSHMHNVATQSVSVGYKAAQAFANVLNANGIKATPAYRLD